MENFLALTSERSRTPPSTTLENFLRRPNLWVWCLWILRRESSGGHNPGSVPFPLKMDKKETPIMSKDYNAQGQQDAAAGTYNPPNGAVGETIAILTSSREGAQQVIDANQQYSAGWNNANDQKR
jgi:hypothetical protein